MQNPQKCVRTDRDTCFARQASAAFAACLQSEGSEQFSRAVRAAGVTCQSSVEAFREDLSRAARRIAEPSSTMHAHPHDLAAPGQIQWVPHVATVLPSAQLTTLRARNSDARGLDHENQTAI